MRSTNVSTPAIETRGETGFLIIFFLVVAVLAFVWPIVALALGFWWMANEKQDLSGTLLDIALFAVGGVFLAGALAALKYGGWWWLSVGLHATILLGLVALLLYALTKPEDPRMPSYGGMPYGG